MDVERSRTILLHFTQDTSNNNTDVRLNLPGTLNFEFFLLKNDGAGGEGELPSSVLGRCMAKCIARLYCLLCFQ